MNLGRLKAFTLSSGGGLDLDQARCFLDSLDLGLFLEPIEADLESLNIGEVIRVVEDYKPLDVESACMALALCRGIRERYPEWRYLIDGDGGDENLKDYPIEENPELTVRSVLNNLLLYQEGWGVGSVKHSLTYSGGQSRSYTRTYATLRRYGFEGFSPFTRHQVIEVAEGIPFVALTDYDVGRLYTFAFDCGATVVSLIPTRTGNGAMEAVQERGEFVSPTLEMLEAATVYGLSLGRGRVFVDLWNLERLARCLACFEARVRRLRAMNLHQKVLPPVGCAQCEGGR